jgi:hypothetical protein
MLPYYFPPPVFARHSPPPSSRPVYLSCTRSVHKGPWVATVAEVAAAGSLPGPRVLFADSEFVKARSSKRVLCARTAVALGQLGNVVRASPCAVLPPLGHPPCAATAAAPTLRVLARACACRTVFHRRATAGRRWSAWLRVACSSAHGGVRVRMAELCSRGVF